MDHGDRFSREGSERNSHDLTELVCKFFFLSLSTFHPFSPVLEHLLQIHTSDCL